MEKFEVSPGRPLPDRAPRQAEFDAVLEGAAARALDTLIEDCDRRTSGLRELVGLAKR